MTRRSFSTNVALTLFATVTPALAAALTLPTLYRLLGADRLGVLTLAWVAIGSFALLDAGLGRALTHETSQLLARDRAADIRPLVKGSLLLLGAIGATATLGIVLGADAIVSRLHAAGALGPEIRTTLLVCAAAVPLMTVSAGIRGVLEAYGRFDMTSLVRVTLGAATYLGPWLAVRSYNSLVLAVAAIVAARFVSVVVLYVFMESTLGAPVVASVSAWPEVRRTLAGGIWMTLAGVAGAALTVVDRLILGAMVSLAAIAFYSTPQELIGKLTLVPMALSAVLFPALSAAAARESNDLTRLFTRGIRYTFALVFPLAAVGAGLANEWLGLWLGKDFALPSHHVAQWFCLSVLLQSLAVTPLNLLQAAGRAHVTAWLQLAQLPIFIAAVWYAVSVAGIAGAAFVWAARMLLDLSLLLWLSSRYSPGLLGPIRSWSAGIGLAVIFFVAMTRFDSLMARGTLLAVGLSLFAASLPRLIGHDDLAQFRALAARHLSRQAQA
ncbi:MAG TPA: oligosaccharide flippase family protein [Vicinamibacterales bacterium]|nr:oligosaccharide flippase family protein [Vicinamibacterales bacterium]